MKKNITPKLLGVKEEKVVAPSVSTLNFLKQFAHTYYTDKRIAEPLNSVILN